MNILFWNTYRNKNKENIDDCLLELINEKNCDLVILCEYTNELTNLCHKLNAEAKESYKILPNNRGCDHIKGFTKKKYKIENLFEESRYQILKLETTAYTLLITALHNVSKWHSDESTQRAVLTRMHDDIKQQEKTNKTKNSIIIGDFNINPFDSICVEASCLFAIPYKSEVKKEKEVKNNIEYEKFYNPTWKFLSNEEIPHASYYYKGSSVVNYYWNMYDQVLIRPRLIDAFDKNSFSIITHTKNHNLLLNNQPNTDNYSDHLPIFCEFKEEKIL